MPKKYSDRQMKPERESRVYFFPKAEGGPVSILAKSREEAEKQLQAVTKKKND